MKKNILILHGWNWKNYPKNNQGSPWADRLNFFHALEREFTVTAPVLPGFCNAMIPDAPWMLDDYATWLFDSIKEHEYDMLLGYSFGAAVIVRCLTLYKHQLKKIPDVILVSPAILRKYRAQSGLISAVAKVTKNFPKISNWLRHIYLTQIVKNKFYSEGELFHRETYRNIVHIDLSGELEQLLKSSISLKLIFGSEDTSTPPQILLSKVPDIKPIIRIIRGGAHDIANSHTKEVLDLII